MRRAITLSVFTSLSLLLVSCPAPQTSAPAPNSVDIPAPKNSKIDNPFGIKFYFCTDDESVSNGPAETNCYSSGGHSVSAKKDDPFNPGTLCLYYSHCSYSDDDTTPNNNEENQNNCYSLTVETGDGNPVSVPCGDTSGGGHLKPPTGPDATSGGGGGSGGDPSFNLRVYSGSNQPDGAFPIPNDDPDQQATFSPGDSNDAFDWTTLAINDTANIGWTLEIENKNGKKVYTETGTGFTLIDWSGTGFSSGLYTARLSNGTDPSIERTLKIDNTPPKIKNLKVIPDSANDQVMVSATILEQGSDGSGIAPYRFRLTPDDESITVTDQKYNASTGEYSVTLQGYATYMQARTDNGVEYPFELAAQDYAWNLTSTRTTGTDGPLSLKLSDGNPYFSTLEASTRKSISVEVEDQQGQDWILEVKSPGNGTVKTYTGNGNTSITWDGKNDGGALLPEGKYRFVIKTAARKDFVKHTLPVWIDLTPPEISYEYEARPDGRKTLVVKLRDTLSGLDLSTTDIQVDGASPLSEPDKVGYPKKATYKFTMTDFPIIIADDSNYSIQSTPNQSQATSRDQAGATATIPIGANPNPIPNINENKVECFLSHYLNDGTRLRDKQIRFINAYDFDRRQGPGLKTRNLTLVFQIYRTHNGEYGNSDFLDNLSVTAANQQNIIIRSGKEGKQNYKLESYKKNLFYDAITDGMYNTSEVGITEFQKQRNTIPIRDFASFLEHIPGLPRSLAPKEGLLFISVDANSLKSQDQQIKVTIPSGDENYKNEINLYLINSNDITNNWSGVKCNGG